MAALETNDHPKHLMFRLMFRNEKHLLVSPHTHWSTGLYCLLGWINVIVFFISKQIFTVCCMQYTVDYYCKTYCNCLQLWKQLFEFPRNFLQRQKQFLFFSDTMDFSYKGVLRNKKTKKDILTSHVWLRRLTAAVFRPIIMAKKQLRFLCALQL